MVRKIFQLRKSQSLILKQPPKKQKRQSGAPPPEKKAQRSKLAKENDITAAEEAEIKEAFTLFSQEHPDYPNSKEGAISTGSVRRALTALGTPPSSAGELQELLETVDPDESGWVPYEHFVAIAALKLNARTDDTVNEEVETAFRLFTRGSAEKITLGSLRRIARDLKEDVDEQVLKDMISEANGGSGIGHGVGLQEFEGVMRRAGVFK